MLILKRVELQGFKSFPDRTEMRFPGRGIAAIVGPNGCGKSNLSDAISWVLGEQSAKSLRGSRMEDVIFAGTRDRKPLGMAQVTMVLVDPTGQVQIPGQRPSAKAAAGKAEKKANGANGNGANGHGAAEENAAAEAAVPPAVTLAPAAALPEKAQEITVTRRLFRSGESEYLINGKTARLRDIQELFMGTGLGPESYAIIEQGRIGQILSSKPLDRRAVIEEACGISKFKNKRRLAEAKLEGAKQNLTRVFDILEEVSRQVNSLKRQAGKAKRYEELKAELDRHLRVALAGRYLLLEREAARIAADLEAASASFAELQARAAAEDQAIAAAREEFYRLEAALTDARKRAAEARLESERVRGQIATQAREIASIEQRLQQGEQETEQLAQRAARQEQEREHLAAQLVELEAAAADARARLSAKQQERDALQRDLSQKERALEEMRRRVVALLGEASSLRNQLAQIESFLSAIERDRARVRKDAETAQADLARVRAAREELSRQISDRQLQLESTQDRRARTEKELQERRSAAAETRRRLEALRHEASSLRARRDSLEQILSHRAYTAESVKRLFQAAQRGEADGFAPAGVLADFVELTHPEFEKAAEEFLHEELEYVVVKSWEDARKGIELLRGDLDGRATFLVEPNLHGSTPAVSSPVPEPAIGPETGIVGRLSEGIRFTNGLTNAPAALLPRLARCFLAESREAAQRLAAVYPDLFFLLADGVCYHGQAVTGGRRTGAGPLALKRELREVSALCDQRHAELSAAQQELERLEKEIHALTETLEHLRAEQQKQEKETLLLEQEMRKLNEEAQRAEQRLSLAGVELERLNRDAARAAAERDSKAAVAAEKEQQRAQLEQQMEGARAEIEHLRRQLDATGEEHSVLRVELAGCEERRRGVQQALDRLVREMQETAARRRNLAAELENLAVRRNQLLELNLALEERATRAAADFERFELEAATLAEKETAQRAALAEAEERVKETRQRLAEAQERRAQIELELVRRQSDLRHLDENCRKELGLPVLDVAAQLDVPPAAQESVPGGSASDENAPAEAAAPAAPAEPAGLDEAAVAQAEEKAEELRRRIEALGPVNPEALSEYQEAQQRYDFLNAQRQDLLDSIRDTEKTIREIDAESRKRFNEAFAAINENFRNMFRTLFGGGIGEMRLSGEGDELDQGIEIVAQPPGKRLQNVLLLSGGEKALTAIALLMAIFQYQPSPFCVLDEVDAPLDEANVGRLAALLKEMSEHTQFIVITHAKKTMEAAELLYGVTMQEQGVSRLVSVKLQPAAVPPPQPPDAIQTAARA
ncbi:MAG: chromosome segregation protein SMC [Bryobacteraceae bacterium]|nr:chromosome segregation protein SMC [Bryobacteraceae bacterium]